MKTILAGLVMVLAGCATTTVTELGNAAPLLTMETKTDVRASAKCVVSFLDTRGLRSSVRDFGDDVQVVLEGPSYGSAIAVFSIRPRPVGGSLIEVRGKEGTDPDSRKRVWEKYLAPCS